jgi:hypothetical protein
MSDINAIYNGLPSLAKHDWRLNGFYPSLETEGLKSPF